MTKLTKEPTTEKHEPPSPEVSEQTVEFVKLQYKLAVVTDQRNKALDELAEAHTLISILSTKN